MRIGTGFDVHLLVAGRPLVLGGLAIDYPLGLEGHSDADVLTHALMDALLGAAGLGDIGRHFPDSEARYKNISSLKLLEEVGKKLTVLNLKLVNADLTLIGEAPKIAPYAEQIVKNLNAALKIPAGCVNLKATTTEGLLFSGLKQGMAAQAVVLLQKDQ